MTEPTTPETSASSEASRKSSAADSPDLLSDCQIMLRYALKEGLTVPDELRHDVAELDQDLVKMNLTPVSAMPAALFGPGAASAAESLFPSELLLKVHSALSRLISPATALTLQVSEPPPGRHRFLGGLPALVKIASWVALGCAVGFVATSIPAANEKAKEAQSKLVTPTPTPTPTTAPATVLAPGNTPSLTPTPIPTPTPSPVSTSSPPDQAKSDVLSKEIIARYPWLQWIKKIIKALLPSVNAAFGAGLGASFYILLSTQPYLTNRSFDPKYNAIYACRFITGLIGGIILSVALGPVIARQIEGGPFPITPGILAILGGYAAEAVQQILQRLVEVLVTAVRGDGSTQAQAKATAAQTQQAARMQKLLTDYERETDPKKKQALLDQMHQLLVPPAANP